VLARALDEMLRETEQPLDAVVLLDVDYGELTRRIAGRRSCADCGKVFNVFTSPVPEDEPCPKTRQPHRIVQRSDDNEAAVAERLKVYDEKTKPLIDYYSQQELLRSIPADGEVDDVTARLNAVLHTPAGPAVAPAPRRSPARHRRRKAHRPPGLASTERATRRRPAKRKPAAATKKAVPKKGTARTRAAARAPTRKKKVVRAKKKVSPRARPKARPTPKRAKKKAPAKRAKPARRR
jgi:adenylate kinase